MRVGWQSSKVRLGIVGVVLALAAVACGSGSSGGSGPSTGGGGAAKGTVVLGTTDTIVSADPAGSYDLASWTLQYNVYQTLLGVPPGTSDIAPQAANCQFNGNTTYVCKLIAGQAFSNGDPVTADDVVYSFNRVLKINDPSGPGSLFAPMKSVTASGNTVTFTLKAPDATWPDVLTTAAASIVDKNVFPADKLLADDKVVGSGPYQLSTYTPNQLAEFTPNPHYGGTDHLSNAKFIVKYEQDASTLVSDAQSGAVDIAYRTLSPTQLQALQGSSGISLEQGKGIEIRYLVFNERLGPGTNDAHGLAIRQAAAQVVDRSTIASQVYRSTVQPLYSIVPQGLNGATEALKTAYGASPDVAKAKQTLTAAGVTTPVPLTLWYNVNHYNDADLATELMRELNASGLFNVKLQTAEWATYDKAALSDSYGAFLFGWFPDYPDADDYTGPFFPCKTAFLNDHYCNAKVDSLIAAEEASTNAAQRLDDFAQMQTQLATDVPLIPLWQGGQVAAVHSGVTGVQGTLDPAYDFRFWLVGKS
ncbi:MAG TPA: ABC transporter substrate-binding protein [Mycobacteriales bacterium]|nr:ABC transporter substrate-binding protein [Mycobacteriales bacterium]